MLIDSIVVVATEQYFSQLVWRIGLRLKRFGMVLGLAGVGGWGTFVRALSGAQWGQPPLSLPAVLLRQRESPSVPIQNNIRAAISENNTSF